MSKQFYGKLLFFLKGYCMPPRLILASTSPYRRALLERLDVPFETMRPEVDETPRPGERPQALVSRLAAAKAGAAATQFEGGLAIGSDQVAAYDGVVLGKPGGHDAAVAQLRAVSGRVVEFLTGVCVRDLSNADERQDVAITRVRFRTLDEAAIERYLAREPAYDCAGSFKSEGLGITLVDAIEGDDPTALVGLPLVRLCRLLRVFGLSP
ncbi:MAG: Maf family nucleotide pyrophosphatase [Gammaproteobacteria bacterium]